MNEIATTLTEPTEYVQFWNHTAIQLARKAGLGNIRFITEDVERYPFDGHFDLAFSRFGMMFFENPVRAMKNIRRALRPGGEPTPVVQGHSPWQTLRLCHSSLKSPGSGT